MEVVNHQVVYTSLLWTDPIDHSSHNLMLFKTQEDNYHEVAQTSELCTKFNLLLRLHLKLCTHGRGSLNYASILHNSLDSTIYDIVTRNILDSSPDGVCNTIFTTKEKCYEIDNYLERHHEGSHQQYMPRSCE